MTDLYNCKTVPGGHRITKFDSNLNVVVDPKTGVTSSYILDDNGNCECPRGPKHTCRHRQMLPLFKKENNVDKLVFLEFDTRQWRIPTRAQLEAMGLWEEPEPSRGPIASGLIEEIQTDEDGLELEEDEEEFGEYANEQSVPVERPPEPAPSQHSAAVAPSSSRELGAFIFPKPKL